MADFLSGLRAHGSADLNSLLSTLNDGGLARETVGYWKTNGWITLAPDTPLVALAGPRFDSRLTLRQFCGAGPAEVEVTRRETGREGEEVENDEDS